MSTLPVPGPEALAHSARQATHIRDAIDAAGGWLSFARYMELALYAPGLGYYAAGATKFGQAGDFTTAPEMSALFGRALARQVAQVLEGGDIMEIGAGSGKLAADLLLELERLGALPPRYDILELSGELKARQQATLTVRAPHLLERVRWLDHLPETFSGVMLGNEVLDAMPVHIVAKREGHWQERGVIADETGFGWEVRALSDPALATALQALNVPDGYLTEINLAAPGFIASLAGCLQRGVMLFIDYGFPRAEFYHPQRSEGTLMCHYRHRAHGDPLILVGLQDITAHVDFTAIAEAAHDAGLAVLGYTSQAAFLLALGLTRFAEEAPQEDTRARLAMAQQVKTLTLPSEMGELFKVLALGRGVTPPLLGFTLQDRRARL